MAVGRHDVCQHLHSFKVFFEIFGMLVWTGLVKNALATW